MLSRGTVSPVGAGSEMSREYRWLLLATSAISPESVKLLHPVRVRRSIRVHSAKGTTLPSLILVAKEDKLRRRTKSR